MDLLIGGEKVEFGDAAAEFLWSEISERRALMSRLEEAQEKRLRPWTASQGEFERRAADIKREAEIVAVIAEIIQREEYEYWDDDDYLAYCEHMKQHAQEVARFAEEKNLSEAQRAVGEISKTCSECHEGYR